MNIRDASIRYTDNLVFEHLNWRIEPGQHWQLTGPNGSGKTCLLNLIPATTRNATPMIFLFVVTSAAMVKASGILNSTSVMYRPLYSGTIASASAVKTSLFQVFMTALALYNKATDLQEEIAAQWLKILGLQHRAGQPFNQFSYGDQRLLLIARAVVKHPHLLILDEPCFGLDDMNRQLVLALIEKICAGSETTVIYVNHHAQDQIEGIENYLAIGRT